MRITYREYKELTVDDWPHAELIDTPVPAPRPSRTERFVRGAWGVTCWLVPALFAVIAALLVVVGFVVLELLLLIAAGGGLLGRGLDHAGRAAARNSRVITASAEVLAQLPRPRLEQKIVRVPAIVTVRNR